MIYASASGRRALCGSFVAVAAACLSLLLNGGRSMADTPLPVPWNVLDIGTVAPAGTSISSGAGAEFTLSGGGIGIAGAADGYRFAYQSASEDFTLTARLASQTEGNPSAQAGLMVRDALSATSNFAGILVTQDAGAQIAFRADYSPNVTVERPGFSPGSRVWLRLVRHGSVVSGYAADDNGGKPGQWHRIAADAPTSAGMVYVGLCVTSGVQGQEATARFDHTSLASGLQQSWIEDGTYFLHPFNAPALELNGSAGPAAPVVTALPEAGAAQKWIITNKGDGYCSIVLSGSANLALTVADSDGHPGTKLLLMPNKGLDAQLWSIVPAESDGSSYYNILSKSAPGRGIDNFEGSKVPGASVDLWVNAVGDKHLQWSIVPVPT